MTTSGKRIDPLMEEYYQFYKERRCKNCQLFYPAPWSVRTGTCLQSGGTVNREWTCNLDADGNIRVTRQRIIA